MGSSCVKLIKIFKNLNKLTDGPNNAFVQYYFIIRLSRYENIKYFAGKFPNSAQMVKNNKKNNKGKSR